MPSSEGFWRVCFCGGERSFVIQSTIGLPAVFPVWLSDTALDTLTLGYLSAGTAYTLRAKARNGDGIETAWSTDALGSTLNFLLKHARYRGNVRLMGGFRMK